ncbi:LacI family DNA-binding transcriptional regulator [Galbibacter mesophilus]|uniref:LacI family DNA-binding transcriptional regulator n=1 Tax=Galbibacter mesophilus TaxID=379069 RepID=UPI00191DADEF|nr:LacI family DNA-binding transcriptional regulator [Galbibacter mesophilus]MCM5662405.1 LacI family transcriptional regulator [Galbibacter mesophilus]
MKKSKPTIHEIAKLLNIDSSTVSRALNDSKLVTQKTKDKVLKKAKEIGYQRNMLASNLRKSKSNTIGVIVPRISRHFFSSTIAGIEEAAYTHGYNVVIAQSMEKLEREKRIVGNFISNRVDGVLVSVSMETVSAEHLERFNQTNTPLVFFDRALPNVNNSKVLIDDYQASLQATEHLIEMGCKKIAHLSGPKNLAIYKNRLKGYKDALKLNDIPFDSKLVFASALHQEDGYRLADDIIKSKKAIDGIVSANDLAAIGAMKKLKESKVRIPEDIAVVGFSNEPMSAVIEPALSTVDQSGYDIGKIACNLLIDSLKNDGAIATKTVTLSPTLIKRASTLR